MLPNLISFAMRKLPTKYAQRDIRVTRDTNGVAHISAPSWIDGLYGLGYMHGVDRRTQMLFSRTVASGTAAERISDTKELVEMDRYFRRAGLYRQLDRELELLNEKNRIEIQSYCDGVNDGVKQSGRSLPMWATGFYPRGWDPQAVLLIGNMLSFAGLSIGQRESERLLLELIHLGINDDRLRELFAPRLDNVDFDLLRKVKISPQLSDKTLELMTDLPRLVGSNAWAVSPSHSATGHALLASDPHLEVNRLPAIWYETAISWGDHYVMGVTLPGCPLFAVARTERISWGVTYMKGDTCDYFVELCRQKETRQKESSSCSETMPTPPIRNGSEIQNGFVIPSTNGNSVDNTYPAKEDSAPWQYRRGQQWHDFQVRVETIHRKNGPTEQLKILENDQGTLESEPEEGGPGHYLSLAWTGHNEGSGYAMAVWLDVMGCGDARQAMDVVSRSPQPSLCWVFADRDGHIGMQGSGWFPTRRKGNSGLTPVPAWDKRNHWQNWIPRSELPSVYDPPEGFIATANENINAPGGPDFVTMPVPDYRKRRIDERLNQLSEITLSDMQSIQYDVESIHAREILAELLPYLEEGPFKERLSGWDHKYTPESVEATLFNRFYRNVVMEIFGHEEGIGWRRMLYLCSRVGYSTMMLTAIDRILLRKESRWWKKRDKGEMIRTAAEKTAQEPDQPWSKTNAFHFTNRFFNNRRVGRVLGFHSGAKAMPGCPATPFQGHVMSSATRETTFAPSYHFVTDMGTDEAWTNLPGGPSESRFSKFYKCDIPLWLSGKYKCLKPSEKKK